MSEVIGPRALVWEFGVGLCFRAHIFAVIRLSSNAGLALKQVSACIHARINLQEPQGVLRAQHYNEG